MKKRMIMITKSLKKNNKVVLGLSGGVDSTTAALLLKEKGFEVTGYYFDVLGTNDEGRQKAADLAERMGIDFYTECVKDEFEEKIIGNFCSEYCGGRTPNPCTICNPLIKFKKLIEIADKVGAEYIATGHYARVYKDEKSGLSYIQKGVNEKKDQSYMLYRLSQDVISRLILPLGDIEDKEETRELSRAFKMPNAEAKDSQEICFINEAEESHTEFIEKRTGKAVPGDFVDSDGKVLGKHKGIINYTIGQRKGLGIALGKPAFVIAIDPVKNQVVLGNNEDLFKKEVCSGDNIFSAPLQTEALLSQGSIDIYAKIRYAAKPSKAKISKLDDGRILTVFEEAQRAMTPGQSIVFYVDDKVIGGGFIDL